MNHPVAADEGDHQRRLEAVGLFVAGALSPADRAETQAHLRTCARCRDELVDVAALPGLVARLRGPAHDTVERIPEPRPGARERLLAEGAARARRRRAQARLLVAACVLPLILAVGVFVAILPLRGSTGEPSGPAPIAMQRVDPAVDVSGALTMERRAWGTSVQVEMSWARGGRAVLVAVGRDGRADQAASWTSVAGQDIRCTGATALQPDDVGRFEVRNDAGTVLLVLPM